MTIQNSVKSLVVTILLAADPVSRVAVFLYSKCLEGVAAKAGLT